MHWARWEAALWVFAMGVGLGITGWLLWVDAGHDVDRYLQAPIASAPSTVYSAPIHVRQGDPLDPAGLSLDLLGAGYERVLELGGPAEFVLTSAGAEIWTAATSGPGFEVPAGRSTISMGDGTVTGTRPASGVVLAPTALATLGDLDSRRTPISLDTVSPWIAPAVMAIEDARFRDHRGIDPVGILRALFHNLTRTGLHGGSTLTQQLAKNLFLSSDRTIRRKIREVFFAAALEQKLDKDQLLALYLSEVYLGHVNGVPLHGVEQASRAWFGKSATRLTLSEAAAMAGVISSPNTNSPLKSPEKALERRDVVLDRMIATRVVSREEAASARQRPLATVGSAPSVSWRAPWAVSVALDAAEKALGNDHVSGEGYRIYTHIQPHLQRAAQAAVRNGMEKLEAEHEGAAGVEGALVAVRHGDGAVLALVGGRDWAHSPFNRAVQAWRQAGSTTKPLTMLAAFDRDRSLTPITVFDDAPITRRSGSKSWSPGNYDGEYEGPVTLRTAIEKSRNIPAVLLSERVGLTRLRTFLEEAGLSRATALPSVALGAFLTTPLELAGAYTAFANGGVAHRPEILLGVSDAEGTALHVAVSPRSQLASDWSAALSTSILQGVLTSGTGRGAAAYGLKGAVAGKTGTTDKGRDAWFVGFDPEISVAVWAGLDRGDLGLTGSRAALPTWSTFMAAVGAPHGAFDQPGGMVTAEVCRETNQRACASCTDSYREVFARSHVPEPVCGPAVAKATRRARKGNGFFRRMLGGDGQDTDAVSEQTRALKTRP